MGVGEDFKLFCENLTVNNRSDISDRSTYQYRRGTSPNSK